MKTTKPISTVSYNTVPFLIGALDRLVKSEMITFYVFIEHEPEEDENKPHCHVFMLPAKQLDTLWLRKQFLEPDPEHPDTPKGVLPIESSKFVDWYWYGLHDKAYLASKGQSRKFHYDPAQMITNDVDYLQDLERRNPNPKAELLRVLELIQRGLTKAEIALQMNVPIHRLQYWSNGVDTLVHMVNVDVTDRNGQDGHEIEQRKELPNDEHKSEIRDD